MTLLKAADWLDAHDLNRGYYGFGLAAYDDPDKRPHAIAVWPPGSVQRLDACDIMGAVLWAAGATDLGDPTTAAAMHECADRLRSQGIKQSPCAWNDKPGRTKHEVAALLRDAACTHDGGNVGLVDDPEPGWLTCTSCTHRRPKEQ